MVTRESMQISKPSLYFMLPAPFELPYLVCVSMCLFVDKKTIRAKTRRPLLRAESRIENVNAKTRKDRVTQRYNNNRASCNIVSLFRQNSRYLSRYSVSKLYNPNSSLVAYRSENKGNAPFAMSPSIYREPVVCKITATSLAFRRTRKTPMVALVVLVVMLDAEGIAVISPMPPPSQKISSCRLPSSS